MDRWWSFGGGVRTNINAPIHSKQLSVKLEIYSVESLKSLKLGTVSRFFEGALYVLDVHRLHFLGFIVN